MNESLFSRLYKYSLNASNTNESQENYLTEAFAGVLKSLSIELRNKLINELLNNNVEFNLNTCEIITQNYYIGPKNSRNFPDLTLTDSETYTIFIENKWDADIDLFQLKNYRELLIKDKSKCKYLILITKKFDIIKNEEIELLGKDINCFTHLYWNDINKILRKDLFKNIYLITEFNNYLKEQGAALEKISNSIIQGSKDIFSLIYLIDKIARSLQSENLITKFDFTGSSNQYTSQKLFLKESVIYINYRFVDGKLIFNTNDGNNNLPDYNWPGFPTQKGIEFDFSKYNFFNKVEVDQERTLKDFIVNEVLIKFDK